MLTLQTIKLKNGSVGGVVNYLNQTGEYYAQAGSVLPDARWQGKGMQGSELLDPTRDQNMDFAHLLAGQDPLDPSKKLINRQVLGFDIGLSCPKSFSIALAVERDEEKRKKMIEVMERANDKAMEFLQDQLSLRTGKGGNGKREEIEKTFVRTVMHIDSREGDAHAHFHNVLCNVAIGKDGKPRAIDGSQIFSAQKAAGAVFDFELAKGMSEFHAIERSVERDDFGRATGKVHWNIAGISRDTELEFSKRRKQILKCVEEDGLTKAQASEKTRKGKELTPSEILTNTRDEISRLGLGWETAEELRQQNPQGKCWEQMEMREVMEQLHATDSAWTRNDLIELLAKGGRLDSDPVAKADALLREHVERGNILDLQPGRQGEARFCTAQELAMQEETAGRALARKDETRHHLTPTAVERAISAHESELGFAMNDEQRDAVRFVCGRTGGMAVITGYAGTGKTTFAGAFVKAFQAEGYEVIGASTSAVATTNLADEARIKGLNTAQLLNALKSEKVKLTDKHVLILDEAGMMGARQFAEMQRFADSAGAKIVAIGDCNQLQPIESGNAFKVAIDNLGDKKLQEIRRQRNEPELAIAKAFYSDATGQEIVQKMRDSGSVEQTRNQKQAVKKLVKDYNADERPDQDKLIVVQTHADAKTVTNELRQALKAEGKLGQEREINIKSGNGRDSIEKVDFAVGDRIRFTKNNKELKVLNGNMAEILSFEKHAMTIRMDGNAEAMTISLDSKRNDFTHGYARTAHSAQGLGAESVYWLGHKNLSREMGLVAFTRTKQDFKLYGSERTIEGIEQALNNRATKETAMELLRPNDAGLSELRIQSHKQSTQRKEFIRQVEEGGKRVVAEEVEFLTRKNREISEAHKPYETQLAKVENARSNLTAVAKKYRQQEVEAEEKAMSASLFTKRFRHEQWEKAKQPRKAAEEHLEAEKQKANRIKPKNYDEQTQKYRQNERNMAFWKSANGKIEAEKWSVENEHHKRIEDFDKAKRREQKSSNRTIGERFSEQAIKQKQQQELKPKKYTQLYKDEPPTQRPVQQRKGPSLSL